MSGRIATLLHTKLILLLQIQWLFVQFPLSFLIRALHSKSKKIGIIVGCVPSVLWVGILNVEGVTWMPGYHCLIIQGCEVVIHCCAQKRHY